VAPLFRRPPRFEDRWRDVVRSRLTGWRALDADEQSRIETTTARFVDQWTWEAARGVDLTEDMQVTIAAHAALLALGLGTAELSRAVDAVVVHASTMHLRGPRPGPSAHVVTDSPLPVAGHTDLHGPVFVAWDAARADLQPGATGNVILHELTHKLDAADGTMDGTPPLKGADLRRWVEVCTAAFEAVRQGLDRDLLRSYAGTNPAEFFAVATETFFVRPWELADRRPALFEVLRGYYRQDPRRLVSRPEVQPTPDSLT
jgi:Mlc titration factor MtfA (ptsG expression regulator)